MSVEQVTAQVPVELAERRSLSQRLTEIVVMPLLQALAVSFGVVVVTFFLIHAFLGDPARTKLGVNASQAQVDALRAQWGLNRPIGEQFVNYLAGLTHGDLGNSIQGTGTTVASLVFGSIGNTVILALSGLAVAVVIGLAAAMLSALTGIRAIDHIMRAVAMLTLSSPPALIGLLLIYGLAVRAHLFPVGGWGSGYPQNFYYLALPVLAVALGIAGIIYRVVRERALQVVLESHFEAARSRGMHPLRLALRHLLPNCALPALTVIGLSAGALLSGAVVVEAVFGVPGLGRLLVNALNTSDFPVIQGAAMVSGIAVALCNALAEVAQRAVDPRTRA